MIMNFDDSGPGYENSDLDAVVLLHAGVADRRMWDPQWDELTSRWRTVRPDLRGYGDTPVPGGTFSYADDVSALMDELGLRRVGLVGSSFGGRVALEVASRNSRVERLVLLAPAARGYEPTPDVVAFGDTEDELLEAGDVDGASALNVTTWLGPDASGEARALVHEMQRHAFEVQLAADELPQPPEPRWADVEPETITCETVIIIGDRDLGMFRAIADDLAARIPRCHLVRLPWAAHLPTLERPDEGSALLVEALSSRPR